ncbi:PREDICTED: probable FBD-associated F-box protein At1g32375 [Camelina sativa]|uniref:Probable FBD-associated F-box protein At1g32375 n=1 Tax=Camelina sativa TaxID=90675 RepID=A0ABM0WUE6_CAMSA|nr:PREDICTED: probable FBD-associated F-box protein At1g32375 [Camelina sativa]
MDRISQLPDDLLLKILSNLPFTNNVMATMVLSKRWQFLWMLVPKLVYDDGYNDLKRERFIRFVDRSLLLHEAPVLETLHFKLGKTCDVQDFRVWIRDAHKLCPRELIIEIDNHSENDTPVTLFRSLYKCFRMLVTLKLSYAVLVNDLSSDISFPFLKRLSLKAMGYPDDDFVVKLLSSCPVLEDLDVTLCTFDNVVILSVRVPSLKTLVVSILDEGKLLDVYGFVIDTPNLECLKIDDYSSRGFCVVENNMPKILNAVVCCYDPQILILKSIISAKRLNLCLPTSKNAYPVGSVFHRLVHLTLCTCETEWLNLLMCLLRDSPKLRALKLIQDHDLRNNQQRPSWSEPTTVPECLLTSLETLEWVKYEGTEEEKQVVGFILRNGNFLKKVTIDPNCTDDADGSKKLEMMNELLLLPSCSSVCRFAFD